MAADEITAQPGMGQCMITGKYVPEDELVTIQGYRVCAEGKAILLERLKAGDQMPGEMEKPSVLLRLGCLLLDGLVLVIPIIVVAVLVMFGLSVGTSPSSAMFAQGVMTLIMTAIQILYFGAMHATRGQTLGKMAGKIRVVNRDGTPISTRTAYVRAFAYVGPNLLNGLLQLTGMQIVAGLSSLILFVWVLTDFIMPLVNSEQRSLHDVIAGTRVIKNS